jgi:hypothetical protein
MPSLAASQIGHAALELLEPSLDAEAMPAQGSPSCATSPLNQPAGWRDATARDGLSSCADTVTGERLKSPSRASALALED